jgi:serine/threonine-protein kinase HipA
MTLLGYTDVSGHETGASNLEMAEFIMKHGANVNTDLEEMWRRIAFNICVRNTADHSRNHGFLLTERGWRLSPAYDINPNEFGNGLSLNISEKYNPLHLELASSVAEYFRLDKKQAEKIIAEIKSIIGKWRSIAKKYCNIKTEKDKMSKAFE